PADRRGRTRVAARRSWPPPISSPSTSLRASSAAARPRCCGACSRPPSSPIPPCWSTSSERSASIICCCGTSTRAPWCSRADAYAAPSAPTSPQPSATCTASGSGGRSRGSTGWPAVDPIGPDQLFAGDPADPSGTRQDARRWLGPVAAATPPETGVGQASAHDRDVYAFSVTVDRALDWTAFGIWLTMLLHAHGEDILRVKGLLQVVGVPTPVVIHGVQHLVHPPVHLDGWPTADRGTRLVFIVQKLPRQ